MRNRFFPRVVSAMLLAAGLVYAQIAGAVLLGISPTSTTTLPFVSGGNQGTLSFTGGKLALNGLTSRWTDVPLSTADYGTKAGYLFAVGSTTAAASLKLNFNVSAAGVPSGAPGDDLVLTGDAYAGPPSYALLHSGTLLTGEIVSLGSSASGGFGVLDMRFRVTGGALAPLFAGKDIGLRVDLEATTFTGSFATSFSAGRAKPALGGIGQLCVKMQKEISVDGGLTWADADTKDAVDTPIVTVPHDAEYRLVVSNCGTANLRNVAVSDPTLNVNYTIGTLSAGASQTVSKVEAAALDVIGRCANAGVLVNSSQVKATAASTSETVTASDDAVIKCVTTPQIDIKKQISVDAGTTWFDADAAATAPVVTAPHGAEYRFIVTNTGTADLTAVVVNDATLGIVDYPVGNLAVGASVTVGVAQVPAASVAQRCANPGEFTNSASAGGQSVDDGSLVNDADVAVLVCAGQPGIEVVKQISVDGGVSWADANAPGDADTPTVPFPHDAEYRFIVRNLGSVDLTNVVVTDVDPAFNVSYTVPGLLPVAGEVVITSGDVGGALTVVNRCDASGSKTNVVSVTGESAATGDPVTDSDPAVINCVGTPAVKLRKQVSLDGVTWADADDAATAPTATAPADAYYRFLVSNVGNVGLVNTVVSDPALGIVHTVGALAVGQSLIIDAGVIPTGLFVPNRCTGAGQFVNVADVTADAADTGATVGDTDPAVLVCTTPPLASLGDLAWLDANNNGIQDPGESGLAGVTFNLTGSDGSSYTTASDANGNYRFDGLTPGVQYTMQCVAPTGYQYSPQDQGTDDALDSDVDGTGTSGVYVLGAGEYNPTADCGLYLPPVTDCGCDGKVTELTLKYLGSTDAIVKVVQKKDGAVVFNGPLAAGGTFSFSGQDKNGTLTTEIAIYVDGVLNTNIHTSCSVDIGPGLIAGDFEVVEGASRGFPALCPVDTPPPPPPGDDCGCEGKVTELSLKYLGSTDAIIKVVQKKDGAVVFNGPVAAGGTFNFSGQDKNGTLTTEIAIYVDGVLNTKIHTSCSVDIGPGLVAGDFEVVEGASRGYPALCPVGTPPPPPVTGSCDLKVEKTVTPDTITCACGGGSSGSDSDSDSDSDKRGKGDSDGSDSDSDSDSGSAGNCSCTAGSGSTDSDSGGDSDSGKDHNRNGDTDDSDSDSGHDSDSDSAGHGGAGACPAGQSVTYTYAIANDGAALSGVTVKDDKLGDLTDLLGSGTLASGARVTLTKQACLSRTTTNVVEVRGSTATGEQCQASDSATVTVSPSAPLPGGCNAADSDSDADSGKSGGASDSDREHDSDSDSDGKCGTKSDSDSDSHSDSDSGHHKK